MIISFARTRIRMLAVRWLSRLIRTVCYFAIDWTWQIRWGHFFGCISSRCRSLHWVFHFLWLAWSSGKHLIWWLPKLVTLISSTISCLLQVVINLRRRFFVTTSILIGCWILRMLHIIIANTGVRRWTLQSLLFVIVLWNGVIIGATSLGSLSLDTVTEPISGTSIRKPHIPCPWSRIIFLWDVIIQHTLLHVLFD